MEKEIILIWGAEINKKSEKRVNKEKWLKYICVYWVRNFSVLNVKWGHALEKKKKEKNCKRKVKRYKNVKYICI